jgi:hypothetical protein
MEGSKASPFPTGLTSMTVLQIAGRRDHRACPVPITWDRIMRKMTAKLQL